MHLKNELNKAYDELNIEEAIKLSATEKDILKTLTLDLINVRLRVAAGDPSANKDLKFIEASIENLAGIGIARAQNISSMILDKVLSIALKALDVAL